MRLLVTGDLVKGREPGELVRAVAFWDGMSKGTIDCLTRCVKAGVEVRIVPK